MLKVQNKKSPLNEDKVGFHVKHQHLKEESYYMHYFLAFASSFSSLLAFSSAGDLSLAASVPRFKSGISSPSLGGFARLEPWLTFSANFFFSSKSASEPWAPSCLSWAGFSASVAAALWTWFDMVVSPYGLLGSLQLFSVADRLNIFHAVQAIHRIDIGSIIIELCTEIVDKFIFLTFMIRIYDGYEQNGILFRNKITSL